MLANDGLAPGGGTDFGEEDVDQQQPTLADQQVGRRDVAVGQAGLQSVRMMPRPSSMTCSSTSASPSSTAPPKNSVTSRCSRPG
jgi:hypothetical protein